MNYVGQLAGQVFVQVKELYRGLNPATLSGCIDVIVVRQPDGSLQCSPFHVRFGKMGVLRSREKVVDIEINGEPVSLHMKLGENGEAFFVKETENKMEVVPSYLATSPIMSTGQELMKSQLARGNSRHHGSPLPVQNLGLQQSEGGLNKKRRKRKKKARPEGGGGGAGLRREESGEEFSDDEDMFTIDLSSDEEMEGDSRSLPHDPETLKDMQKKSVYNPKQMFDFNFSSSPDDSQSSTPKSDSELTNPSKDNPEMLWTWGELPQAAQVHNHTWHHIVTCVCWLCLLGMAAFKSTRSQHLGADGIYLDDITELEPEVAALYFPKTDGGSSSMKGDSEMMVGVRSANQSPQSVGSSGVDSGVDSLVDQVCDLPHVAISLCGGLTDNREITKEQFMEKAVSYQQFSENPSIIDDPNLVVKIGSKYYNWNTAAPVMLAMQVYQKPLPQASVENIMKDKMPKKGGRWWFSWRSRNNDYKSVSAQIDMLMVNLLKDESSSSDEDHRSSSQVSGVFQSEPLESSGGICYKKTLRLTSEQLASLQLKEGPNEVVFSVTTQYQGTCRCHGTIYLWSWDDKIVISDIDGTITRSDTLGHILPTLGKDWTHQGIARLYHRVSLNGYKFMYCSARAIGMADMTRGYLHWVNERGTMLPMGPVLLSPSSLFSALHREVIEKKPEKFKIECLTDIKHLFYPNTEPFYAAFGNRATDVYSYKEVGVPLNRIFTVNPKGELVQEHAKTNISSYGRLCDMVDHVFPVLMQGEEADFPHSDAFDQCNYWNKVLPEGTIQGEEDPQPAKMS
uniref:phosphatidate phosphatase n=1 Tax=Oreochromis niloticus TaxID=8128 RepID=A0A669DRV4_ORENI